MTTIADRPEEPPKKRRRWVSRILLLVISLGVAILLLELALYLLIPDRTFKAADEMDWMRDSKHDLSKIYTIDEDLGFRPITPGPRYDQWGTQKNSYDLRKPEGKTRLLFIGDSVTARGRIVDALKERYGFKKFEWWNAGVESFSTVQEVAYYERWNHKIAPDHVILTFHVNDFATTPVAFFNDDGKFIVYSPSRPIAELNPWLFQHSRLYRLWLGATGRITGEENSEALRSEVKAAVRRLRDQLAANDIAFTVIVHPVLAAGSDWTDQERTDHALALTMLGDLGIRHFALTEPLTRALADGVTVEGPDRHHPSVDVAGRFATFLGDRGLLSP